MPYKDKEKHKACARASYWRHKEERQTARREWGLQNRDKLNAAQRRYAATHPDVWKKRRDSHPSLVNHRAMMSRCYNPKDINYRYYGEKGIIVYKPWHDFKTYEKEWGCTKPGLKYTQDRLNSNGHYAPWNVQWLTKSENVSKGGK